MKNYRVNGELVGEIKDDRLENGLSIYFNDIDKFIDLDTIGKKIYRNNGLEIEYRNCEYCVHAANYRGKIQLKSNGHNIRILCAKMNTLIIFGKSTTISIDNGVKLDRIIIDRCKELYVNGNINSPVIANELISNSINLLKIVGAGITDIKILNNTDTLDVRTNYFLCERFISENSQNINMELDRALFYKLRIQSENVNIVNEINYSICSRVIQTIIKAKKVRMSFAKTEIKSSVAYSTNYKGKEILHAIANNLNIDLDNFDYRTVADIEADTLKMKNTGWIDELNTNANIINDYIEVEDKTIKLTSDIFAGALKKYGKINRIDCNGHYIVMQNNDIIETNIIDNPKIYLGFGTHNCKLYIKDNINYTRFMETVIPINSNFIYTDYLSTAHRKLAANLVKVNIIGEIVDDDVHKLDNRLAMLGKSEQNEVIKLIREALEETDETLYEDIEVGGETIKVHSTVATYIKLARRLGIDNKNDIIKHSGRRDEVLVRYTKDSDIKIYRDLYPGLSIEVVLRRQLYERWYIGEQRTIYVSDTEITENESKKLNVFKRLYYISKEMGADTLLKNSLRYDSNYQDLNDAGHNLYHSLTYMRGRSSDDDKHKEDFIILGDDIIYKDGSNRIFMDKETVESKIKELKDRIWEEIRNYNEQN